MTTTKEIIKNFRRKVRRLAIDNAIGKESSMKSLRKEAKRVIPVKELGIQITITRDGEEVTHRSTSNFEVAEQQLESLRRQFQEDYEWKNNKKKKRRVL